MGAWANSGVRYKVWFWRHGRGLSCWHLYGRSNSQPWTSANNSLMMQLLRAEHKQKHNRPRWRWDLAMPVWRLRSMEGYQFGMGRRPSSWQHYSNRHRLQGNEKFSFWAQSKSNWTRPLQYIEVVRRILGAPFEMVLWSAKWYFRS